MLTDFPLEGEDTPPQINFSFFVCGSRRYDASDLAVSSSGHGAHVWITTWSGQEYSVLLQPSDFDALDAEPLIRVCDDGSLWLSVQMRDENGNSLEVLLSDSDIDRFLSCLEAALATSALLPQ